MLDNRETAKTETAKTAIGPLKVNQSDTSPNRNNGEVHLQFNGQTLRDRNTQPMPVKLAAGAGCLVLFCFLIGLRKSDVIISQGDESKKPTSV